MKCSASKQRTSVLIKSCYYKQRAFDKNNYKYKSSTLNSTSQVNVGWAAVAKTYNFIGVTQICRVNGLKTGCYYHYNGVSNHRGLYYFIDRLFRRQSKKTSKFRVTGLCVGNSPVPVNSPHKGPVTRKMFLFDNVIMMNSNTSMPPTSVYIRTKYSLFTKERVELGLHMAFEIFECGHGRTHWLHA